MAFERTREFFSGGGVLLSSGGSLSRSLAAIGLAAAVTVVASPAGDGRPAHSGDAPRAEAAAPAPAAPAAPAFSLDSMSEAADAVGRMLSVHFRRAAQLAQVHRFGDYEVTQFVAEQIVKAAKDTGFSPAGLMAIAEKESSFDCEARPPKGSAYGCFQFINSTWLEVVRDHGAEFGLAAEAAMVETKVVKGKVHYFIADQAQEDRVLAMRKDPYLAGVLTVRNLETARTRIEARVNSALHDDDLYLPHFLGTNGTGSLIERVSAQPDQLARKAFPEAASYNGRMFRNLTVRQFHAKARAVIATRQAKYRDVEAVIGYAEAQDYARMADSFMEKVRAAAAERVKDSLEGAELRR